MTFDPASLLISPDNAPSDNIIHINDLAVELSADQPDILAQNPDLLQKIKILMTSATSAVTQFDDSVWSLAEIAQNLEGGKTYALGWQASSARQYACWALEQYDFEAFQGSDVAPASQKHLVVEDDDTRQMAQAITRAIWLVRDLVNQPANLLGPQELADAATALADRHQATSQVLAGALIEQQFPAIYAVGQASAPGREPRVVDFSWGDKGPQITLVGKGVCYDTGGLNLKPGAFMRNMKKDMGGSAHVLGLASLIMDLNLPVRLRVIIGAVENSVAGNSFRPGDVIKTRKGLTVEIGNTDAEGRLVLADCLTLAQEQGAPDLLIDFATLTGAARVALGTEMPAVFSNTQPLADQLVRHGHQIADFLWSLPLYRPYAKRLESSVADLGNIAEGERYGDAIIAALFLDHFVEAKTPWLHLDCFAWNNKERPGRPKGGEAQALLACLELVQSRVVSAV